MLAEDALVPSWRSFVVAGAVLAVIQIGFYLTAAALPLYLRDHGAPEARIGFDVGLGSLSGVALVLLAGPAINRYGPVLFLRLAAAVYLIASLGMLLVPQEVSITAFRALQGSGMAVAIPSTYTLGAQLLPRRPATALGMLGALNSLALAAGPPIGLQLYVGRSAVWLFLPAAATAALGLGATVILPRHEPSPEPASGLGFDLSWLPSILGNMLFAANFGGILAYLPLYLRQLHGPNAGIFFTADALGVLLLRVPTGMLADRYGSFLPKLIGLVVTLPGLAALFLRPSVATLVVAGAGTGVGAGLFITGVLGDLSRRSTEANRGTAMSLGSGSFSGAIFAGGIVSGLLIGPYGWNAIVWLGVMTCLASLPFVVWGQRSAPTPPS